MCAGSSSNAGGRHALDVLDVVIEVLSYLDLGEHKSARFINKMFNTTADEASSLHPGVVAYIPTIEHAIPMSKKNRIALVGKLSKYLFRYKSNAEYSGMVQSLVCEMPVRDDVISQYTNVRDLVLSISRVFDSPARTTGLLHNCQINLEDIYVMTKLETLRITTLGSGRSYIKLVTIRRRNYIGVPYKAVFPASLKKLLLQNVIIEIVGITGLTCLLASPSTLTHLWYENEAGNAFYSFKMSKMLPLLTGLTHITLPSKTFFTIAEARYLDADTIECITLAPNTNNYSLTEDLDFENSDASRAAVLHLFSFYRVRMLEKADVFNCYNSYLNSDLWSTSTCASYSSNTARSATYALTSPFQPRTTHLMFYEAPSRSPARITLPISVYVHAYYNSSSSPTYSVKSKTDCQYVYIRMTRSGTCDTHVASFVSPKCGFTSYQTVNISYFDEEDEDELPQAFLDMITKEGQMPVFATFEFTEPLHHAFCVDRPIFNITRYSE